MRIHGPERPGGQGLDRNQEESGNRAILALLTDDEVRDQVDLVITHRDDAYEVWAGRGMVRFRRLLTDDGAFSFEVVEQMGEYFVFVLGDSSKVAQRKVVLGARVGDKIVARDGVKEGDKVVTEGVQKIRDGVKVQVGAPGAAGANPKAGGQQGK